MTKFKPGMTSSINPMKNTLSYPHCLINALKLIFFISSLTSNTTRVIGQIPNMPSNILQYHQSINLAELAIINDNYTEALTQYKNAFNILPGFLPDRYNAILLTKQKYDAELLYDCADYFFNVEYVWSFLLNSLN